MYDGRPHPLLAQVPLTVSPFISLPTATTLPYTYKSLPSTLPPSSTGDSDNAKYIVSASGHAAHPDEIVASCKALQAHLQKLQEDAEKTLTEWEDGIKQRELAEKRRLAPGWLDREEKILEPEKKRDSIAGTAPAVHSNNIMDMDSESEQAGAQAMMDLPSNSRGEELDRAFGSMGLHPR